MTKRHDDDCEVELAHLNQCLLTCAKAERGCVLIIRRRDRMGAAVCMICGLWHQSRKMDFRCEATRSPLSTVPVCQLWGRSTGQQVELIFNRDDDRFGRSPPNLVIFNDLTI